MTSRAAIVFILFAAIGAGIPMATQLSGSLATQIETDGVVVEDLAKTLPLPFASEPTTASLERIVIAPGASIDTDFVGPVLFYIEEGALNIDVERHQVAIVQAGDQKAVRGEQKIKRGNIPAGFGIYSADGNPGPLRNNGDGDLEMLAVLFVPQPNYADGGVTISATAMAPVASPSP
jgi:hypothetical protein